MALSEIYFARGDNNSANNASLNVVNLRQVQVQQIQFTTFGPNGDLVLDGNAAGTLVDPDTRVLLNGTEYQFELEFQGYYNPSAGNNGRLDSVPPAPNTNFLDGTGVPGQGDRVIVITVLRPAAEGGNLRLFFHPDGSISKATMQNFPNGAKTLTGITTGTALICFVRETMILTPAGEVPVETLGAGDLVTNHAGKAMPLIWVGHSRVAAATLARAPQLRPIRIPAGLMGPGRPNRDLLVSPQHRVLIEGWQVDLLFASGGVLVPAKHLLGDGVHQVACDGAVDYYHLLFEDHEIVLSNGLASESLQPTRENVSSVDPEARAELEALFPGGIPEAMAGRPAAAMSLKAHEGRLLRAELG